MEACFMAENQRIPFNFTYFAMKLLGKNLYSNPWTAISEIVANGVDAGAENVFVLVDMRNKEKAVVEIFDDGTGMSFDDLRQKYALIGRNKRLENDNVKGKTLGRKGIGKLAALYLSPKYYIYTKTEHARSAWMIDTQGILDSDVPALVETEYDDGRIISYNEWTSLKTGTLIHLSDVDLRKIGPERLKSLPLILADYYLESVIPVEIKVCVIESDDAKIEFTKIKKDIRFDTMYAIFDNTGLNYKDRLQPSVYLTKNTVYKEVDVPKRTVVLDETKYSCSGVVRMNDLNGNIKDLKCKMVGWIGIHSSIDNEVLKRNSKSGGKIQNHPNALRLYVRGKLAVNNLMNYVGSTAAFAPYIEGEISFDVLDDDLYEDASTSNREGYSVSDPRIKELINIVSKIITSLVIERNKAGAEINRQILSIKAKKEQEAKEAKLNAERAEAARKNEELLRKKAEKEADKLHAQNNTIFSALTEEQESFSAKTHLVKTNAIAIRNSITTLARKIGVDQYKEVGAIAISSDKILSVLRYSALANFNIEDEYICVDLFKFCYEYIDCVLRKQYFAIDFKMQIDGEYVRRFNPQYISLVLDNFVSNSQKSNATEFTIKMSNKEKIAEIEICDNGKGLCGVNLENIFEFGYSNTGGSGIGLFNIKKAIASMCGEVYAKTNEGGGARFIIRFEE